MKPIVRRYYSEDLTDEELDSEYLRISRLISKITQLILDNRNISMQCYVNHVEYDEEGEEINCDTIKISLARDHIEDNIYDEKICTISDGYHKLLSFLNKRREEMKEEIGKRTFKKYSYIPLPDHLIIGKIKND